MTYRDTSSGPSIEHDDPEANDTKQADIAANATSNGTARPKPARPKGPPHPITTRLPYPGTLEGEDVVYIPLSGKHGIGHELIVSTCDYPWVRDQFGLHFIRSVNPKDPRGRPASGRKQVIEAARNNGIHVSGGKAPLVLLQRVIEWAIEGDTVFVKNGNPYDLRRSNLESVNNKDLQAIIAHLIETGDGWMIGR